MANSPFCAALRRFALGPMALLGLLSSIGAYAADGNLSGAVTTLAAEVRDLERRYVTLSARIAEQNARLARSEQAVSRRETELAALTALLVAETSGPRWLALFAPQSAVAQARRAAYTHWLAERVATARAVLEDRMATLRARKTALLSERRELDAVADALRARRNALSDRLGDDLPRRAQPDGPAALADRLDDLGTLLDSLGDGEPGDEDPAAAAGRAIVLSTLPAGGRLIAGFEPDRGHKGVTLATAPGAFVYAPAAGAVAFAGPFRRYGVVLILKHDDGYHSVITGLDRLAVDVGAPVTAGQPVGTVRDDRETPEIYYELRRRGRPVDPVALLTPSTKSDRKAWENGQ